MDGLFEKRREIRATVGGPLTSILLPLCAQLDQLPPPAEVTCPEELQTLVGLVYQGHKLPLPRFKNSRGCKIDASGISISKNCAVLFSGGNDSLAAAIAVSESGMVPVLYHVLGANRSYAGEYAVCQKLAARLGWNLETDTLKVKYRSPYSDHPLKNQLLAAMAFDRFYSGGMLRLSGGMRPGDSMVVSNVNFNWSDACEVVREFNGWVASVCNHWQWVWTVENRSHAIKIILNKGRDLFEISNGCVTPYRFQKVRAATILKKYGVIIPGGRCGYCHKCCADYLNFVCAGVCPSHPEFIRHCLSRLKTQYAVQYGQDMTLPQVVEEAVHHTVFDNRQLMALI